VAEVKLRIKQVDEGSQGIQKFGGNLRGMMNVAGKAALAVGAIATAAKIAYDEIEKGAKIDRAIRQFDALTTSIGSTSDVMLGRLREATKGMVSDVELMESTSELINTGLAKTEDQAVRLATAVGTLGLDMSVLNLTLLNDSKMRLDNLKISAERVAEIQEQLNREGFVGDAFDEAVIIALEEKMTLLEDTTEGTAANMAVLRATVKNTRDEVSLFFQKLADPAIENLANSTEIGRKAIRNQAIEIAKASDNWKEFIPALEEAFGPDVWNNAVMRMEAGQGAFVDLGNGVSIFVSELEGIIDKTDDYVYALEDLSRAGQEAAQQNKEWAAATEAAAADMVLLKDITHSADNAATDYNLTLEELAQLGRSKLPEAVQNVNEKLAEQELAAIRAEEEMRALNDRMGEYFDSALNATGPADSLASIMYDAGLNAGLNAEQMAILAGATGEFTEAQIEAALKTAFMTEQINLMVQAIGPDFSVDDAVGALGLLEEGLATSAEEAMQLWEEMNKIPPEVNSRVVVTYKTDKTEWLPPPDAPPTNWGGPSGAGQDDSDYVGNNGQRAVGGPVWGGGMFQVGEFNQPELLQQNGRLFLIPGDQGNVIPSGQAGGMGSVTVEAPVNIVVQGGDNARDMEWAIRRGVNDGLRQALAAAGLV